MVFGHMFMFVLLMNIPYHDFVGRLKQFLFMFLFTIWVFRLVYYSWVNLDFQVEYHSHLSCSSSPVLEERWVLIWLRVLLAGYYPRKRNWTSSMIFSSECENNILASTWEPWKRVSWTPQVQTLQLLTHVGEWKWAWWVENLANNF